MLSRFCLHSYHNEVSGRPTFITRRGSSCWQVFGLASTVRLTNCPWIAASPFNPPFVTVPWQMLFGCLSQTHASFLPSACRYQMACFAFSHGSPWAAVVPRLLEAQHHTGLYLIHSRHLHLSRQMPFPPLALEWGILFLLKVTFWIWVVLWYFVKFCLLTILGPKGLFSSGNTSLCPSTGSVEEQTNISIKMLWEHCCWRSLQKCIRAMRDGNERRSILLHQVLVEMSRIKSKCTFVNTVKVKFWE